MQTVIVASLNPAKIKAVESAFGEVFPEQAFSFDGVSVDSEVSDQPLSNEETKLGAQNRVSNAKQVIQSADYYVGLEAGIEGNATFAWMVIESKGQHGESRSSSLMLPPKVLSLIEQGKELGDAMDEVYGTNNIKQKGGAIGILTNNRLSRSSVYHQALILALIPFVNQDAF
ncbi:inosine/xanthosine triphosphatase [Vibrio breoganii]|uniref:inosine/xanthosine triphosphatase n=1 Tax=Vibrio breoganii TaxID=553239 RepID=UPI000C8539D7|nr:inosine/xanthosine triphosphatase [Vibrio breoganii]PMG02338.1 inosine/xanthosine triphosphatase [Vibrio breoganii]PMG08096.1 inosine/xanthosine triphosphatase [Vibrio breoganii]PMG82291.1 inosine/xanthosine triphosphatase [Vibrio breoganii]PMG92029.1 inosine/xanthosine triphosphatase [Vibrio breoganii]PMI18687.1 inosine/xanthosine triphosphatase [Vibrio breoganii]